MVSDIHLGEIMHNGRLMKLVKTIETLQPDILLLPGDVIDEDVGTFIKQEMAATFQKLAPKYGMYAVPGNHEYIGRQIETVVRYLEEAGIRVLRDEYVKVLDSFYIVGRDDKSQAYYGSELERKGLKRILEGVDDNLPLLLLAHQPNQLDEAVTNGIDLQLSGHTHKGQLFPINFITGNMFEIDYGLIHKGSLNVIVSSGFGTWGPPIRIGNRPEIVDIVINFLP
jgi:predicted MPP superfamily phosphohydrolase